MILIIGASGGIGNYLFNKFSTDGYKVKGTYNKSRFENQDLVKLDICNSSDVEKWLKAIEHDLEKITVINCVGINYNCFAHKANLAEWKNVIDVNLIGSFNIIRNVLPYMRAERYGRIINLSSIVPQVGVPGTSAYAASKSGLWGMAKSIAKENAALSITINSLNLGYFDAGMIESIPADMLSGIIENIPAKRLGYLDEIYKTIKIVMEVEYINGSSIDINGGM